MQVFVRCHLCSYIAVTTKMTTGQKLGRNQNIELVFESQCFALQRAELNN